MDRLEIVVQEGAEPAVQCVTTRANARPTISPGARPTEILPVFIYKEDVRAGSMAIHVTTELSAKFRQWG